MNDVATHFGMTPGGDMGSFHPVGIAHRMGHSGRQKLTALLQRNIFVDVAAAVRPTCVRLPTVLPHRETAANAFATSNIGEFVSIKNQSHIPVGRGRTACFAFTSSPSALRLWIQSLAAIYATSGKFTKFTGSTIM